MSEPFIVLVSSLFAVCLLVGLLAVYLKKRKEAKAPFDFSGTKPFEDKTSQAKHAKQESPEKKGSRAGLTALLTLTIAAGALVGLLLFRFCSFA